MLEKIFNTLFSRKKKRLSASKKSEYNKLQLQYTLVKNLSIGMYVAELDRPWLESPFAFQGFIIEDEQTLLKVKEICEYVYIDVSKQTKTKQNNGAAHAAEDHEFTIGETPQRLGTFEKEISRAQSNFQEAGKLVKDFMDKIAEGGGIDTQQAKEAVAACVNSVLHSPDAYLWLLQLKNKDLYTSQHSLNVCVLSIVLGRHINLNESQLNKVGLCGMMHDMGKMLVPLENLNKPGKLDGEELAIMQSHTTLGYELLKSSPGMFSGAIETALTHHERMDGKGYPRKIKASNLSFYSHIVAIADMYDAITSDRVYKLGKTHLQATKIMFENSGSHLQAALTVKFIESLGVYPPGCYVRLSDESIALVIEVNMQSKLRPKVMLILDTEKQAASEKIIDLATNPLDSHGNLLIIREIVDPKNYNIDSKKYYQEGIIQKGFSQSK